MTTILDDILAACEKATPGPWESAGDYPNMLETEQQWRILAHDHLFPEDIRYKVEIPKYSRRSHVDANLIVILRNNAVLLAEALKAGEAWLEADDENVGSNLAENFVCECRVCTTKEAYRAARARLEEGK